MHMVSPQWRDPMQWVFLCAASFVRITSCFMRYTGVFCVVFGMNFGPSADIPRRRSLYARYYPHFGSHDVRGFISGLLCHLVVTMVLLFNIYFNYALCCSTNPGIITSRWKMEETRHHHEGQEDREMDNIEYTGILPRIRPNPIIVKGKNNRKDPIQLPSVFLTDPQSVHVARERGHPSGRSYCRRCRHDRPPRAHHCSICERCIAQLDHHCPWVNNCIGRNNYRYFFSFLVWLGLGCYYAAYMTYKAAYSELNREQHAKMLVLAQVPFLDLSAAHTLQLAFAMSAAAGIAITILASWHAFLIATAQTSVELQINRSLRNRRLQGSSPYSTGSIHGNWELVFGQCKYKLLSLLPSTRLPPDVWNRKQEQHDATAWHDSPATIV